MDFLAAHFSTILSIGGSVIAITAAFYRLEGKVKTLEEGKIKALQDQVRDLMRDANLMRKMAEDIAVIKNDMDWFKKTYQKDNP